MMERAVVGVWCLVCVFLIYVGWDLYAPYSYEPLGPKPYPIILLALMALGAMVLVVRNPGSARPVNKALLLKRAVCVLAMVAYGLTIEWLGFLIASFLLAWVLAVFYGGSVWKGGLAALVISVFAYVAFEYVLDVPLPLGLLDPFFS